MAETSTSTLNADGCLEKGPLQGDFDGTVPLIKSQFDVFINHRGPDVKTTLVSHLAAALCADKFMAFVDYSGIKVGDRAREVIQSAILNSKIHISVFSQGYGESAWCLDELCLIMECSRKKSTELFLPVFFHVTPNDLRSLTPLETSDLHLLTPSSQSQCYKSAFEEHARKYKASTIDDWKEALREASTFKGLIFPKDFQYEAELVESIVTKVTEKLSESMLLPGPEHPVGLDKKLQEALDYMDRVFFRYGRPHVKRFGICGIGGVGKTTLAKAIYNKICRKFESACFIQNVSERHKNVGLTGLQIDLQQQLLKPKREVSNPNSTILSKWLEGKKVLIVLDDVSEKKQLDELMRPTYYCSLGRGSQFVITTRNKQVLEWARVGRTSVWLKGLSTDHALQLLNLHAFPSREETELSVDWKRLVEKVADACQGLPLALEVLGSSLRGKDFSVWANTVKVLGEEGLVDSQRDVTAILRTNYDALRSEEEKEMFLDAACFLFQEPKEKAMRIWRSDYGDANAELYFSNLESKCLVNLDKNGNLTMHDLLRGMGRDIVDNSCKSHYWEKSHLWREKDVKRVLHKRNGTSYVRGLGSKTLKEWDSSSFTGMDELKLLVLDKVTLTGDFGNLPQELRWFQLRNSPLEIPLLLALENVAVLDLEGCRITSFSCGDCKLQNLKELSLNNCSYLTELLIDFSTSSKSLEVLSLSSCVNLDRLPESICELSSSLTYLDVSWCTKLTALPDEIGKLTALCKIRLDEAGLTTLPQSFVFLSSLKSLHLGHSRLRHLPSTIGELSNLIHIRISNCESITQLPEDIGRLIKGRLEELHLCDMKRLFSLPRSISSFLMLKVLNLRGCSSLQEIRALPTSLASLVVGGCTSLVHLDMSACSKLEAFPEGLETLHNLSDLILGEYTNEEMVDTVQIEKLTSLRTLRLSQVFSEAETSIQWIQRLVSIEEVVVCVPPWSNRTLLTDLLWSRSIRLKKKMVPTVWSRRGRPCIGVLCRFWEVVGRENADSEGIVEVVLETDPVSVPKFSQKLMGGHISELGEQAQLHVAMYRAPHALVASLEVGNTIRVRRAHVVRGSIDLMYAHNELEQQESLLVCTVSVQSCKASYRAIGTQARVTHELCQGKSARSTSENRRP